MRNVYHWRGHHDVTVLFVKIDVLKDIITEFIDKFGITRRLPVGTDEEPSLALFIALHRVSSDSVSSNLIPRQLCLPIFESKSKILYSRNFTFLSFDLARFG